MIDLLITGTLLMMIAYVVYLLIKGGNND